MAKRAPKEEKPYNPIEAALVERVASRISQPSEPKAPSQVMELSEHAAAVVPGEPEESALPRRGGRAKRVILSWEDEYALQRLLDDLSQSLQTPVKLSNALRSCVILLRHAQEQIARRAKAADRVSRPPNTDQAAIAIFEDRLAAIFQAGIRESEAIR